MTTLSYQSILLFTHSHLDSFTCHGEYTSIVQWPLTSALRTHTRSAHAIEAHEVVIDTLLSDLFMINLMFDLHNVFNITAIRNDGSDKNQAVIKSISGILSTYFTQVKLLFNKESFIDTKVRWR